jgi:hypothetical protein
MCTAVEPSVLYFCLLNFRFIDALLAPLYIGRELEAPSADVILVTYHSLHGRCFNLSSS